MKHPLRTFRWSPSRITWVSLAATLVIAAAIGIAGTALVLHYLQARLTAHGVEHTQEFASALAESLQPLLLSAQGDPAARAQLQTALDSYRGLGYRVFVLDPEKRLLLADSATPRGLPVPLGDTWLERVTRFDGGPLAWDGLGGAARHLGWDGTVHILWFQQLAGRSEASPTRFLGVARDQKLLHEFMGELQMQLDLVLLLTYALIAILGYFTVRGLGRAYERTLEAEVAERTEELERAHKEVLAKARLATIGQTAAMLTHEMRNPLASIKLVLSGLAGGKGLGEREARRVGLVLGEVDRLNDLLSETLDYVRPIRLSVEPIALDRIIDGVLQLEEPSLREKALSVERVPCTDCEPMRVDEPQLRQVLLNLLRNAIEASPPGASIRIETVRDGAHRLLRVQNAVTGVDGETLRRAFEPFYSTKPKGTGLGLGLVKRVIEEHGGTVQLAEVGGGVRVTIRLPAADVERKV